MRIIGHLPKFPPAWIRIGGGPSKFGLIGHLKHVRLSHSLASLVIILEDEGSHFVGYYHADADTLSRLYEMMQRSVGQPLALLADMEMDG